jgi:hypothetical protein
VIDTWLHRSIQSNKETREPPNPLNSSCPRVVIMVAE